MAMMAVWMGTIKISPTPNERNKNTQPVQLHARQVE